MKVESHDVESVNTQETILRRDTSDVEEAALDEESTAIKRYSETQIPRKTSDTEDFSQSETVGFAEKSLKQVDRAKARRRSRAKSVPHFLMKPGPILL